MFYGVAVWKGEANNGILDSLLSALVGHLIPGIPGILLVLFGL